MKKLVQVSSISGYLALVFFAIVIPPLIAFSSSTCQKPFELCYKLFSFLASLIIVGIALVKFKKINQRSLEEIVSILLPCLVSIYFIYPIAITPFIHKFWDYICLETSARIIVQGGNPYVGGCWVYPPLLAQMLGWCYKIIYATRLKHQNIDLWELVFYFYQCGQFIQVVLAYFLSYFFAKSLGIKKLSALIICSVLFVLNYPLFTNLFANQHNLWILNSILLALFFISLSPELTGLAIAFGAHIKLYPIILLAPLTLIKKWRVIISTILALVLILLIQTKAGKDWELWKNFLISFLSFPKCTNFTCDSLFGIIHGFFLFFASIFRKDIAFLNPLLNGLEKLAILAVLAWIGFRFSLREKTYRKLRQQNQDTNPELEKARIYAHLIDSIGFALLVSPLVLVHQYILAIPILIFASANLGLRDLWKILLCFFLIFPLPTYELFPFSYHRFFGIILLIFFLPPENLKNQSQNHQSHSSLK